jgi:hypothetical protein
MLTGSVRLHFLVGAACLAVLLASARLTTGDDKQTDRKGAAVEIDGLKSQTPAAWLDQKPANKMRFKQFRLPPEKKGEDAAELVIFFFGTGQGGSASDNIDRWKSTFVAEKGKKIDDVAKTEIFKVSGVDVTYLDVSGTYLSKFPPFDPNAKTVKKPNYRLLGVVFESANGPYFIKLTGPAGTVEHYKKGFDEWLKAFK